MKDINFELNCIDAVLPAILLDNGEYLFHAHTTCLFADVATKTNESRWIKDNIPKKWLTEFRRHDQIGRPALYLLLPGFLYTLSQGNSEIALNFRDEVYENILPSIIKNGGYISKSATIKQTIELQLNLHGVQAYRYMQECITVTNNVNDKIPNSILQQHYRDWLEQHNVMFSNGQIEKVSCLLRKFACEQGKYKYFADNQPRVIHKGKYVRGVVGMKFR